MVHSERWSKHPENKLVDRLRETLPNEPGDDFYFEDDGLGLNIGESLRLEVSIVRDTDSENGERNLRVKFEILKVPVGAFSLAGNDDIKTTFYNQD